MTREEALRRVRGYLTDTLPTEDHAEVEEIMAALEGEPCEDCISREAVLNLKQTFYDNAGYETDYVDIEDIEALPPVTPKPKPEYSCEQIKWERDTAIAQLKELGYGLDEKPKAGHWVLDIKNEVTGIYKCSECGRLISLLSVDDKTLKDYPYCHCGAKMSEIPTGSERKDNEHER